MPERRSDASPMRKPFVVISGLPGSGKTTLGRRLAPALDLPLIDKDDILDRLFASKGVGDAAWRRVEPRERWDLGGSSDALRWRHPGGVWRVPGMRSDSGTLAIPDTSTANRPPQKSWRVFESSLGCRRSTSDGGSSSTPPTSRTSQMSCARSARRWNSSLSRERRNGATGRTSRSG
jgi:hypothetical protein